MEADIIKSIVAKVLAIDESKFDYDTQLVNELGADSLDICRILMNVEEEFNVILQKSAVDKMNSVKDICQLINSNGI